LAGSAATGSMTDADELEQIELELLLEGVSRRYGYDFRGYAPGTLRRALRKRVRDEEVGTLSCLQQRVLRDPACFERLLLDLSINVTSMFRDPGFYAALRTTVVPLLRTYPFVRIWNVGCSTGEEALSLAILLHEEGLYERTRVYATDMNDAILRTAAGCRFPLKKMSEYTANYLRAGGREAFSSYYVTDGTSARFDRSLIDNVVFARHNLVCDRAFNEFNVILCRNVLIYFGRALQDQVHALLYESLGRFGVLGLGLRESLRSSRYEELDSAYRLYRRRA
jgi:chemotaxis protein methyltransferase CheR